MSAFQNRHVHIDWRFRLMNSLHRIIAGFLFFAVGSVVSMLAITEINSAWVVGTIAVMNLGTLILVFGVEVNSVEITRGSFKIDFGESDDTE